jgi:regulator of protease activity HflC (stomatin/prohibitin superfamily)
MTVTGRPAAAEADGSSLDGHALDGPWVETADWTFRFLRVLVLVLAVGWLFSGIHRIAADSQAVVFRFGRPVREQGAGLLLAWPRPVERVVVVPAAARQIEFDLPRLNGTQGGPGHASNPQVPRYELDVHTDPRWNTAMLLTGDASIVHLQASLFYQVTDPFAYVLAQEHMAAALDRIFLASAVTTVAGRDLDSVLVARPEKADGPAIAASRERLRGDLVNAVNARLAALASQHSGLGIRVSRVDIAASIPGAAKPAFDNVLTVTQEAQKRIAMARTQGELTAQKAAQEKDRLMTDAIARAGEQVNNAKVQTASIEALGEASSSMPHEMLMKRLYYTRVGTLLHNVGHVETVDASAGAHLILPADAQP